MDQRTRKALLTRSFPTDLIDKISTNDHTVAILSRCSLKKLRRCYSVEEAELINKKISREPINQSVVDHISTCSNNVCCYHADGNSIRPYEIHHIVPYSATQDNSEDNLALVCPTHHVFIHRNHETVAEQKRRRSKWYALAELARAYEARGLAFPYGTFEAVVYSGEFNLREFLEMEPPSPVSARALTCHALGGSGIERLKKQHFLAVIGDSGSGKSTFALGVAGFVSEEGLQVFRYKPSSTGDNRSALREIMTFIGTAVSPCVLILDDVNAWAESSDLEPIAAAASQSVKVIATWTRTTNQDGASIDSHLPFKTIYLSWDAIQPVVSSLLLSQEPQVVPILRELRGHADTRELGFDVVEQKLLTLLKDYGDTARNVWQFLFLLRAGWRSVKDVLSELIADGRADIPVLFAAVEQIAGVENPITIDEATKLSASINHTRSLPIPDSAWIKEVFDRLVQRRYMIKVRNAYTILHRRYALALICAALENRQTKDSTVRILERDLNRSTKNPRRLLILSSWLREYKEGRMFVNDWVERQSTSKWEELVNSAINAGLIDTALVITDLNRAFPSTSGTSLAGDLFERNEHGFTRLVQMASSEDWYWLNEIFGLIGRLKPEFSTRVIQAWSPEIVAQLLSHTHPDHYHSAVWFFSSVSNHSLEWCKEVGRNLDFDAIRNNLSLVRPGDVDTFDELLNLLDKVHAPIHRTMISRIADGIRDSLETATLSEIRFSFPIGMLGAFPDESSRAVEGLNPQRYADEIYATGARQWQNLLVLCLFAAPTGSSFGATLVDSLDDNRLQQTAAKWAVVHPHAVRVLTSILTYGRPKRRRELARILFPFILSAAQSSDFERANLLENLAEMDATLATDLANQLGVEPPKRKTHQARERLLFEGTDIWDKLRVLDQAGADYDVSPIFSGRDAS